MTDLPDWDEATRAQIAAANPGVSTWLSANAGSGKTRVLTDRVARLLLDQVEPQHILCLTYTKAAASEMQNRLFKRLGQWAMMDDDVLRPALRDLGVRGTVTPEKLRTARTLFAQAIETPGGLKIQTIHSFCASLLRRFPLEARVSPQFTEIEDRAADLLRAEIIDGMAEGIDAPLVANVARFYTDEDFSGLTKQITGHRDKIDRDISKQDLITVFNLPAEFDPDILPAQIMDDAVRRWMPEALDVFRGESGTLMVTLVSQLEGINFETPMAVDLERLKDALLTADRQPKKRIPSKGSEQPLGALLDLFRDLMDRTAEAHDLSLRHLNVARTAALHRFAKRFISLYEGEKQRRGWLDFDDLILRARALLNDKDVAAWVLFRIDGGIDHILVDEAQDTSPRQWDVIEKLADEFSAGRGAKDNRSRTLFVVGDKKQSIYSFQGADPREFDRKRVMFQERFEGAGLPFQNQSLDYSFRSSNAILRAVDHTFDPRVNIKMETQTRHLAFKESLPGRVDLWNLVETVKTKEDREWHTPLDRPSPQHHTVILAERIAAQIKHLVASANFIPDDGPENTLIKRQITPGDFLILVQRRSALFSEIIRACKEAGLPIAGADRLKVGAELAVRDIGALLSFLATPDDSLSLATALKSPIFGWSEQQLFTLAHSRTEPNLWQALRTQTETHPDTLAMLRDLRGQVDFLRPYDLIERILTLHDGRRKLQARLGPEAEDGIDALLNQALAYERSAVPSLTGFLGWMETDDLEIKRQIDSASDQIRVMTTHGAKGLEAPIVILPDAGAITEKVRDEIINLDGVPIWKPSNAQMPSVVTARVDEMKAVQLEERLRLLYVAMTRAEKWLIVVAGGDLPKDEQSWYQIVEKGLRHANAVPFQNAQASGLRFQERDWDDLPQAEKSQKARAIPKLEPVFLNALKTTPKRAESLSPSDLGGAKALAGDAGEDTEAALSYGNLVHKLLELLPQLAPQDRPAFGRSLIRLAPADTGNAALAEALTVLNTPDLSHLFDENTLAEVAVSTQINGHNIYGMIDRLIVTDTKITAIDYKTNRIVPHDIAACPIGLLRQMGAYAHALAEIYPDRDIETAILWTQGASLVVLPHDIVRSALHASPHLDGSAAAT